MAGSPYDGVDVKEWLPITKKLLCQHPLKSEEIVEVVLQSWQDMFDSKLGPKEFKIGKDIFPQPQILAFLLHELIPLELATRYPGKWRRDLSGADKDLVYEPNDQCSVEIKTSSSANGIFGNRSYAQPTQGDKKSKAGYYLAVNFDSCIENNTEAPQIRLIRFGWLDHSDWVGQAAASGQQAHATPEARKYKFLTLYSSK